MSCIRPLLCIYTYILKLDISIYLKRRSEYEIPQSVAKEVEEIQKEQRDERDMRKASFQIRYIGVRPYGLYLST